MVARFSVWTLIIYYVLMICVVLTWKFGGRPGIGLGGWHEKNLGMQTRSFQYLTSIFWKHLRKWMIPNYLLKLISQSKQRFFRFELCKLVEFRDYHWIRDKWWVVWEKSRFYTYLFFHIRKCFEINIIFQNFKSHKKPKNLYNFFKKFIQLRFSKNWFNCLNFFIFLLSNTIKNFCSFSSSNM